MKKQKLTDKDILVHIVIEAKDSKADDLIKYLKEDKKLRFKYWWKDQDWSNRNENTKMENSTANS